MYATPPEARAARKPHVCTNCGELIEIGAQYKRWMSVDDGKSHTSKMHPECLQSLIDEEGQSFEYTPFSGERPKASFDQVYPNGAPMFGTTIKENGDPIMLDENGKRSIFCDVDE